MHVEIVCQDDPDAPYLDGFPVPVHAIGARPSTYAFSAEVLHWLRQNVARFDGVVINSIWTFPSLAAAIAARGRVPYVVFTHGMLDPWFKHTYPLKHLKKYALLAGAVLDTAPGGEGYVHQHARARSCAAELLAQPLEELCCPVWNGRAAGGKPRRNRRLCMANCLYCAAGATCSSSRASTRRRAAICSSRPSPGRSGPPRCGSRDRRSGSGWTASETAAAGRRSRRSADGFIGPG